MRSFFVLLLSAFVCLGQGFTFSDVAFMGQGKAAAGGADSLLTGLQGHWKMNEASGTRADATANGNNLTVNGADNASAGVMGNAWTNATFGFLLHGDTAALEFGTGNWTIYGWFYTRDNGGVYTVLCKDTNAPAREFTCNVNAGVFTATAFMLSGTDSKSVTAASNPTEWDMFVVWYDAGAQTLNLQIGKGGALGAISSSTAFTPDSPGAGQFSVGADTFGSPTTYFVGAIDDVAKWNRVLTSQEITNLYNGGSGHAF